MLKGLQWPLWLPEAWYNKGCIHRLVSIVINMCLCLSVRLSARISPELHVRSLPNFWCMLPTVVARSSSDEGAKSAIYHCLVISAILQPFSIIKNLAYRPYVA